MAINNDGHVALPRTRLGGSGARLEPLRGRLGAAVLRANRSGLSDNLARLHLAARVNSECHHLATKQRFARLQIAGLWLGAGPEPPLECDACILVLCTR